MSEFSEVAKAKGWSRLQQVDILLEYIDNQQSDAAFKDFLSEQPGEDAPTLARMNALRRTAQKYKTNDGEIEVDDGASVSLGDEPGAYVEAWVWVYDTEIDDEDKEG